MGAVVESLHQVVLFLVDALNLGLREKFGVLLVVFLADVEQFLTHGKAFLDALLIVLLRRLLLRWTLARAKSPDFFLAVAVGGYKLGGDIAVEGELLSDVARLFLRQLFA